MSKYYMNRILQSIASSGNVDTSRAGTYQQTFTIEFYDHSTKSYLSTEQTRNVNIQAKPEIVIPGGGGISGGSSGDGGGGGGRFKPSKPDINKEEEKPRN